jgi:hypothetical protein
VNNCLAFLGLVILVLLVALGVILALTFLDMGELTSQTLTINGTPVLPEDLDALETLVSRGPRIEWSNPLDDEPLPTLLPTDTPTPVPPLDPAVYRTEVMLQANHFGSALQAFLDANEMLAENENLLEDPAWRENMRGLVEQVYASGWALASVGPAPVEYQAIDAWLKRVGPEVEGLRENYLAGLETRETRFFTAASDNLARIREYLLQALEEMARAGWPAE